MVRFIGFTLATIAVLCLVWAIWTVNPPPIPFRIMGTALSILVLWMMYVCFSD